MSKPDWLNRLGGKFIVFDGVDGCGKTTQINLLADLLRAADLEVTVAKDPGGTAVGERIRHLLLDYDLSGMDVRCEVLLFMASRAQLVQEVIGPALAAGRVVLGDRFVSSTVAYQGAAGCRVQEVLEISRFATRDTWPDLTLILDVPVEEGFRRTGRQPTVRRSRKADLLPGQARLFADSGIDAMEARPREFHEEVRRIFLQLPDLYPAPVEILDGTADAQRVHEDVASVLQRRFGG